ncbi:hypothetical protein WJX84_001782 [Apatococcus fuscideae]|uniref:Mitogen-activated protein kinase kinase kinase 1 n=1 Tax=Apatococcus fuscideae TaxID=2026836 RepID=A0AAW1SN09_9CHLO
MDIVDLTESPALSPQYKGKRRQQTEGSSPQPKKRRTKKDQTEGAGGSKAIKPPKTKPEKRTDAAGRTVRFASAASQKVQERIARAMPGSGHRLFLIDRKLVAPVGSDGGPIEEFNVLGATANVYKVTISRHPSCSCPDHAKGNVCKHLLFVMLRVIRLAETDSLVWQRALLTSEAEQVLGGERSTRMDEAVMAAESVREQYQRMTGKTEAGAAADAAGAKARRAIEGDCPICFEDLQAEGNGAQEPLVFCKECGNNVHKQCFERWTNSKKAAGVPITCVLCRAPWEVPADPGDGDKSSYVNLASHSEAHRGASASLEDLYGDRAVWIQANQGLMGRRAAANLWAASQGRM